VAVYSIFFTMTKPNKRNQVEAVAVYSIFFTMTKPNKRNQDQKNGPYERKVADNQFINGSVDDNNSIVDPQESRTESRRSSVVSTLTPEKLLEGLVEFPSLYWWDVAAPGQMTLAALMKIGLIYSTVWMIHQVDSKLREVMFVGNLYAFVTSVLHAGLMSFVFFAKAAYRGFNFAVHLIPINRLHKLVDNFEREVVKYLHQKDNYLAFRIKEYLWTHPRLQETFTELVDDLLHGLLKKSCLSAHPNSTLSRCQQIDNAFEGLNRKSFEVETN